MKLSLQKLRGNFMSLTTHPWTGTTNSFLNMCVCIYTYVCVYMCVSLSCVQIFVTPMDCSPPGFSIHGICQARLLEWVAISFSNIYIYIAFGESKTPISVNSGQFAVNLNFFPVQFCHSVSAIRQSQSKVEEGTIEREGKDLWARKLRLLWRVARTLQILSSWQLEWGVGKEKHLHFTNEVTETQKIWIISQRSQRWKVADWVLQVCTQGRLLISIYGFEIPCVILAGGRDGFLWLIWESD